MCQSTGPTISFSVSGLPDEPEFVGDHLGFGDYDLVLTPVHKPFGARALSDSVGGRYPSGVKQFSRETAEDKLHAARRFQQHTHCLTPPDTIMKPAIVTAAALLVFAISTASARAEEPNETFFESTVLPAGVLSVSDSLEGGGSAPDTIIGVVGQFGGVVFADDDGSFLGDGLASAVFDIPVNTTSVEFVVSGFGDDFFFDGDHNESGDFEAFVTVYDFSGFEIDSFSFVDTLVPGFPNEYEFTNFDYLSGSYDVVLDNTVSSGGVGDVDFFTFTGLTPGDTFTAETVAVDNFPPDTVIGFFPSGSFPTATDDQGGVGNLSLLQDTVPANGQVTLAVTGFDDFDFVGAHPVGGAYDLVLTIDSAGEPGDLDGDGDVDVADSLKWQREDGSSAGLSPLRSNFGFGTIGDFNGDGRVNLADALLWQRTDGSAEMLADWMLGAGGDPVPLVTAVPEPSSALLVGLGSWGLGSWGLGLASLRRRR
ncbi:MAG: hypothetical protein AAGA92_06610 [Planctomycetota bacterium]